MSGAWMRPAGLVGLAALAFAASAWPPTPPPALPGGSEHALGRILAPLSATLAARERVRAEGHFTRGQTGLGFESLARALELQPDATALWVLAVERQGLYLASAVREADPEVRARWIEGALASARLGVERARQPARVAFATGALFLVQAESEPPPAWPGGAAALWLEAAQWFERAAELGDHRGADAAQHCRKQSQERGVPIDGR